MIEKESRKESGRTPFWSQNAPKMAPNKNIKKHADLICRFLACLCRCKWQNGSNISEKTIKKTIKT
jgi:hypothetical protein